METEDLALCTACGEGLAHPHTREVRDVHGHVIKAMDWTTCDNCGISKVLTTWQEFVCPSKEQS